MEQDYNEPVYTIGIVAKKLGVCAATVRIWEKKKLIKPARIGKDRFYSRCDMDRLANIRDMLSVKRINIEGVRNILDTTRCWDVKKCQKKQRESCSVFLKYGR